MTLCIMLRWLFPLHTRVRCVVFVETTTRTVVMISFFLVANKPKTLMNLGWHGRWTYLGICVEAVEDSAHNVSRPKLSCMENPTPAASSVRLMGLSKPATVSLTQQYICRIVCLTFVLWGATKTLCVTVCRLTLWPARVQEFKSSSGGATLSAVSNTQQSLAED